MNELTPILLEFFKKNKIYFLFSCIFLFIVPLNNVVLPSLYGKVVDSLMKGKSIVYYLTLVTLAIMTLQVLDFMSDYNDTHLLPKLQSYIRQKIVLRILNRYEDEIQELEVGNIISKLVKLPGIVTSLFERIKNFVLPNILLHIFAMILFFRIDMYMGLTLLVTLIVLYGIVFKGPKACDNVSVKRDKAFNALHEEIDDNLRNLYSIYGANQKHVELKRMEAQNEKYKDLFKQTVLCSFGIRAFLFPIVIAFVIALMIRINCLITKKLVKVSLFIPVFFITLYIINSFMAIDDNLRAMIFDWGVIQSSMDLIAQTPTRKASKKSIQPLPTQKAGIGMYNVYFKYPNAAKYNLENISLHINHGEKIAIVGEIGSGKSTVLKLLMNYYTPSQGVVYYDGVPFHQISLQQIRKKIGYVPQVPILFNRSIIENIMYGNPNVSRKQVEDLLKEIDMYDELTMKANGLDTLVGKNGSTLSGGQRQLVWVMRVILSEPETIIFDEPTSSMDEKSKKRLRYLLDKYFHDKTVIMVSHDPSILSFAKRILTIENGKVKQENNTFF